MFHIVTLITLLVLWSVHAPAHVPTERLGNAQNDAKVLSIPTSQVQSGHEDHEVSFFNLLQHMIAYWCIWSILYRLVSMHFGTNIQHLKPIYPISFNICIYLQQVVTTYNLTFLLLVFHGFPLILRHAVVSCCINQHNVSHCAWGVLQVHVRA